jgi:regulator of nonsense transcripts 1
MWKEKPQAGVNDLQEKPEEKQFQQVLLRYKNPKQYKEIFEPLIKLEADYDKSFKEQHAQNNIKIKWD